MAFEVVRVGVTRVVVILGFSGASPSFVNCVLLVVLGATRDEDDDDEDEDEDDFTGASPSLENWVFVCLGAAREDDEEEALTGASPSLENCVLPAGLVVPVVLDVVEEDADDLTGASPSLTNWVLPVDLGATRDDDEDDDDLAGALSAWK